MPDAADILDRRAARRRPGHASRRSRSARTSPTGTTRSPGPAPQEILLTLAENLELENQALLRHDATILTAVDHGDRLIEMQARLQTAVATGTTSSPATGSTRVDVSLLVPFGKQYGLSLGLRRRAGR